jgi:hypothetical protein
MQKDVSIPLEIQNAKSRPKFPKLVKFVKSQKLQNLENPRESPQKSIKSLFDNQLRIAKKSPRNRKNPPKVFSP